MERDEEEDGRSAAPVEQHAVDLLREPVPREGAVHAVGRPAVPLQVDAIARPVVAGGHLVRVGVRVRVRIS